MDRISSINFYKKHIFSISFLCFLSVLYSLFITYPLKILKDLVDTSISNITNDLSDYKRILLLCIIYIFCLFLSFLILNIQRFYASKIQYRISREIRRDIYLRLELYYQNFFDETPSSEILSRLIQDSDIVASGIISPVLNFSKSILSFGFSFYFICQINAILALIIFPLAIVIGVITRISGSKFTLLARENRKRNSILWKITQENILSMRDIHANNQEKEKEKSFDSASMSTQENMTKTAKYAMKMNFLNDFSLMILNSTLLISGLLLVLNEKATIGALVTIITYSKSFISPIQSFVLAFQDLFKSNVSKKRINELIFNDTYLLNPKSVSSNNINLQSEIIINFENVNFSYGDKEILNGFTLKLKKEKCYALVGPTGSGKTTILKLCEGLYKKTGGDISIFGCKIDENIYNIRKHMGCAFQDVFLYNDTIQNNILFANPDVDEKNFTDAIYASCVDEIIKKLPNGLNTQVGENGVQLSGGEKQRIGVARALIRNPHLLLLDEATSSLDNDTEHIMIQRIKKQYKRLTILMIAHRLDSIKFCDCIFYIENGKIIESGSEDELIKQKGKYFALKKVTEKRFE